MQYGPGFVPQAHVHFGLGVFPQAAHPHYDWHAAAAAGYAPPPPPHYEGQGQGPTDAGPVGHITVQMESMQLDEGKAASQEQQQQQQLNNP